MSLPGTLIEEFLDNGFGEAPEDYKLYVFHGRVEFIQVDVARFGQHRRKIYDRTWSEQRVELSVPTYSGVLPPPPLLPQLIKIAETLAGNIDFVRVDLYLVGGRVYFGEMTPSSGNGFNRFTPAFYDEIFGSFWKIPSPVLLLFNSFRSHMSWRLSLEPAGKCAGVAGRLPASAQAECARALVGLEPSAPRATAD